MNHKIGNLNYQGLTNSFLLLFYVGISYFVLLFDQTLQMNTVGSLTQGQPSSVKAKINNV